MKLKSTTSSLAVEEDCVVSHKKAFKKEKTKGLKGGKDTEEKRWFILYVC